MNSFSSGILAYIDSDSGGLVCLQTQGQEKGGKLSLGPDERGWERWSSPMDSDSGGLVCLQIEGHWREYPLIVC